MRWCQVAAQMTAAMPSDGNQIVVCRLSVRDIVADTEQPGERTASSDVRLRFTPAVAKGSIADTRRRTRCDACGLHSLDSQHAAFSSSSYCSTNAF